MSTVEEENRVRRRARQRGLKLVKARIRVRQHPAYGTYMLVDAQSREIVACNDETKGYGLTLEQVAAILDR